MHNKWNRMAGGQLEFYALVELLEKAAKEIEVTERLLQQGQNVRNANRKTAHKDVLLMEFWDRNDRNPVEQAIDMVTNLARTIKPTPNLRDEDIDRLPDDLDD